ncbi:hypothetical protein Trydic_g12411 [Trypoxylus dichotomus]
MESQQIVLVNGLGLETLCIVWLRKAPSNPVELHRANVRTDVVQHPPGPETARDATRIDRGWKKSAPTLL